jgi:hypothetical protein
MKAVVLTTAAALAVAGAALFAQQAAAPAPAPMPASPRGTAATQVSGKCAAAKPGDTPRYRDGKWIVVDYGRPILRGRTDIFGTDAEYGKTVNAGAPVWRAGANQTSRVKTEAPLVSQARRSAGRRLFRPEARRWTLVFEPAAPDEVNPNNNRDGARRLRPEVRRPQVPMTTAGTTSIGSSPSPSST